MRLSAKSRYAILAMFELALQYHREFVPVTELAGKHGISRPFLEKLLLQLKRAGLTDSRRGPDGGYSLARPPAEILVGDIFNVIEGPVDFTECFDSPSESDTTNHCMADLFQGIEEGICDVLNSKSLKDLCSQAREFRRRAQPHPTHSFSI